ncbi:MAG: hypothetical protein IKU01_02525 [Bacteroidales bacterium]|nr:hypothetical protein [Bacteroidales bacterium]
MQIDNDVNNIIYDNKQISEVYYGDEKIWEKTGIKIYWNQLVKKGLTNNKNGVEVTFDETTGLMHINGTATSDWTLYGIKSSNAIYTEPVQGNVLYRKLECVNIGDNSYFGGSDEYIAQALNRSYFGFSNFTKTFFSGQGYKQSIESVTAGYRYPLLKIIKGDVFDDVTFRWLVYDLTMMFGKGKEPETIENFYERIEGISVNINAYDSGTYIII